MTPATRIAIIGAGLSGRLLALNLRRHASSAASILMIDRAASDEMGPAYSDPADYLLLNVPAGRMGAFADAPDHFLEWARATGVRAGQWDFLPRRLYRQYVLDLLQHVQRERTTCPPLEHVRGEVTDIEPRRDGAEIRVENAGRFVANRVVLALGNFPPRHPSIQNRSALGSARYVRDPWNTGVLRALSPSDSVILVGTGQTTIDLVISLANRDHQGRIVALSRRGILPLVHHGFESYPSFFAEIEDSRCILDVLRVVRAHIRRAESSGVDPRAVIDSMRPDTQALWQGLPPEEKHRFLRHVFRYWEIIRARIPPESETIVDRMRASGQLEVIAGRIGDLVETEAAMEVHYTPCGAATTRVERADVVINCIGPESDYTRIDQPLVKNLMRRGWIRPGPANLGIDALPDGAIIGRDGSASRVLYTLGSPMKGVLWEVLGAPDIRVQAHQLAQLLDSGGRGDRSTAPSLDSASLAVRHGA